jgi:ankyrin repeat protein
MWAARAGNPESIQVLLRAGADPARVHKSGHNALFYIRGARPKLTFDKSLVGRYDQAESILEGK